MKKILTILIGIGLVVAGSVSAYTIKKGDTPYSLWGSSWKEEMSLQIGHTNEYNLPVGTEVSVDEMIGLAIPTDNYNSFLTSPLSASASIVYVNALPTGVSSTIYTLFASDGTTPREKIYCTSKATSPNQLTGCVRGVSFSPVNGVIDETAGTGLPHSKNTRIAITDNINFSGKALAILNGSQKTDANNFDIGTASSTDGNKCLRFDNSDTDGQICRNASTGNLYWTLDGGSNTYNFTSSTFSQLIASSTGGLSIVDGEILINASSTTGGMIDGDNNYYQAIGNALEYTGNAIAVSTSTLVDQIATQAPTANSIPKSYSTGDIDTGWIPDGGLSIFYYTAGEAIDTTSAPLAVYAGTDGKIYKTSSAVATTTFTFLGFAKSGQTVSADGSIVVQNSGLVYNFTGLTPGSSYFVSTAGTISDTPGTIYYKVARAITSDSLMIEKGKKILVQNINYARQTNASSATISISTGFYPNKITVYGCALIDGTTNSGCPTNGVSTNFGQGYWINGSTTGMTLDTSAASSLTINSGSYLLNFTNLSTYVRISVTSVTNSSVSIFQENTAPGNTDWSTFFGYVIIEGE